MARTGWIIALLLTIAFLLAPDFWDRFRRVRRALGAVLVFWVSLNLWGTSLHVAGLRPPPGEQGALMLLPPFLLAAAWVYWDLRKRRA